MEGKPLSGEKSDLAPRKIVRQNDQDNYRLAEISRWVRSVLIDAQCLHNLEHDIRRTQEKGDDAHLSLRRSKRSLARTFRIGLIGRVKGKGD
jgi:hypothetical protein